MSTKCQSHERNLLPLLHLFHIFSQFSALSLPYSLLFPFDDNSLRNCLQFYSLNYICRWFSGKYFHPNPSKESCTLISISLLGILTQVSFKLPNPTDPRWKISSHPRSVSLPDYPHPSSHQVSNSSVSHTSHNQLPNSVDSTHVIYPTPFCIAETLLQLFITLDLWCGPGILSGLSTSCLS